MLNGSKYMYFTMAEQAKHYMERYPDRKIHVFGTDPDAGLHALLTGAADGVMVVGHLDRDAKEEAAEQGAELAEQIVGWGAVAIVSHPRNPVSELTVEQVRKIFAGEYDNWKDVGGPDLPIVTMTRDEAVSGTEKFFKQFVLKGFPVAPKTVRVLDHDIVRAIWEQPGSVADARFVEAVRGRIRGQVKIIAVKDSNTSEAVLPSAETIQTQLYPISAPMVMYFDSRHTRLGFKEFANFCSRRGLIPKRYSDVKW